MNPAHHPAPPPRKVICAQKAMAARSKRIEFGDFQTPLSLAEEVTRKISDLGIAPDVVIEPTCGIGAFVAAASIQFPDAKVYGYELNDQHLIQLSLNPSVKSNSSISLCQADFFETNWAIETGKHKGKLLILGNLPWVTSATLGSLNSRNLPTKSNFQEHSGFDAISGKANFDISEWMMLELIKELQGRQYDIAMLLKSATARKIIAYVEKSGIGLHKAAIFNIDAKKQFNASVDACLLVLRFSGKQAEATLEYDVFASLSSSESVRVGHRKGISVRDLAVFDKNSHMVGSSPQKWRSGVKHDASSIMELTLSEDGLVNGLGELVDIEDTYLFPLMKGSDIGSGRGWRSKYVLVTQNRTGEDTAHIKIDAPKTWAYLNKHGDALDARGSSIYKSNHRFSIFGIGEYSFLPWKVAICGLYKKLEFRLIGPHANQPIMFDDTVCFVSFESRTDAESAFNKITRPSSLELMNSMIFWDEKRPIKSSMLNKIDWQVEDSP
jgi:hypothetical protein